MCEPMETITIDLEPEVAVRLERQAKKLQCSVAALVLRWLEEYLQAYSAPDAPPERPAP